MRDGRGEKGECLKDGRGKESVFVRWKKERKFVRWKRGEGSVCQMEEGRRDRRGEKDCERREGKVKKGWRCKRRGCVRGESEGKK